jgi:hypothetical protein
MKIKDLCETTASAMGVVVKGVGPMLSRMPKNPDGTAKNALDSDNLMGTKKKTKKRKKA